MPLMIHRDSGQSRVIPGRSRSSYERRGWEIAPPPEPEADDTVDDDGRPAVNDPKSDWVAYAEDLGIDTDGLTKAEVIDAVESV